MNEGVFFVLQIIFLPLSVSEGGVRVKGGGFNYSSTEESLLRVNIGVRQ